MTNNEQNGYSNDVIRDLPPKSPGTRRLMPTVPPKVKRGEVKILFKCKYRECLLEFKNNHY